MHPAGGPTNRKTDPVPSLADDVAWPVAVDDLVIRLATAADADAVWQYRRLGPVSEWLTSGSGELETFRDRFADPEWLDKTLVVERHGAVIGDLMLEVEDAWSQAEVRDQAAAVHAKLGWVFDPAHTGRGHATTSVRELIRIAFEDLGLRRVSADCFAANEPSWRLMERVGMHRETHSRQDSLHRSGAWLDGYTYALLADEWRSTR